MISKALKNGSYRSEQFMVVCLVALMGIACAVCAENLLWRYALNETAKDKFEAIDRNAFLIEARLRGRANDLFYLKQLAEEELKRNPQTPIPSDNLRSALKLMMITRGLYDQVRLLSPAGHEILRFNLGATGAEEVPLSKLQDKSNRPYYLEAIKIPADSSVFSVLDLNVEHEQIEQPIKPVIRISGKIMAPDGTLKALLVLNYLGESLLQDFKKDKSSPRQAMLLNNEGFWLVGPNPTSEWAFINPERKGESLPRQDPELWKIIAEAKRGSIDSKGNFYCFQTIDPVSSATDYSPLRIPIIGAERLQLTLLTKVPDARVWDNVQQIKMGIWVASFLGLAILLPFVWFRLTAVRQRKLDLEKVRWARARLGNVIESSPNGLVVFEAMRDGQGTIIDLHPVIANSATERLIGQSRDQLRTLLVDNPQSRTDHTFEYLCQVIETGKPVSFEKFYPVGENTKWFSTHAAKLDDGVILSFTDITQRKIADEELKLSRLRLLESLAHEQELTRLAQAADRAKSEFLAVMSHEIRTPLNGVIGMTSILANGELNEMQRDCVNTIQISGEALLSVINDILDFSKIESGKLEVEHRSFNLRDCIEESFDLFVASIREKKLEVAYLIESNVPTNIVGDSIRLRQILSNLLGNALKFTKKGEIIINVKCRSRDDKGSDLLFSVSDTGIGIPEEALPRLFKSFQQVDSSTTRRYGGTGLGLAISKRLAELMGGNMWVESKLGVGSTFYFSIILDAAPTVGSLSSQGKSSLLKPCSVLIVDDNDMNRNILSIQVKAWGMDATPVSSGREALQKMEQKKFDIALLDLKMPEMDGIALAKEIHRQNPIPLILLSSCGDQLVGEVGKLFQYQIPKPIKQSHLFNALQHIRHAMPEEVPETVVPPRFDEGLGARHPLRILLAEDNAVNQKVGLGMLEKFGYRASLATNGLQVLAVLEDVPVDLILMDIQMPEMDGILTARKLRERWGPLCPTLIALTAEALAGDRERFLALGFNDYLSKPLSPEELQRALKGVLPLKGR